MLIVESRWWIKRRKLCKYFNFLMFEHFYDKIQGKKENSE